MLDGCTVYVSTVMPFRGEKKYIQVHFLCHKCLYLSTFPHAILSTMSFFLFSHTPMHSSRNSSSISSVIPSSVLLVQLVFYESIYYLYKLYCLCLFPPLDNELLGAERVSYSLASIPNPFALKALDNACRCFWNQASFPEEGFLKLKWYKNFLRPYKSASLSLLHSILIP